MSKEEIQERKFEFKKLVSVQSINGGEILAEDITSDTGVVLISANTVLKEEYKKYLMQLSIDYIYIKDSVTEIVSIGENYLKETKEKCQKMVKDSIEKYFYMGEMELGKLRDVAQMVITDILQDPDTLFNITDLRKKSEDLYSHSLNVCILSVIIAIKMNIENEKVKAIAVGSLLHDIGYPYIISELNNAHLEESNMDLKRETKKHVVYGYYMVEHVDWLQKESKDIIFSHHERMDGSGYPMHLRAPQISIGSRIVGVCDTFDGMVYGVNRKKMKVNKVIEAIVSEAGKKFDMEVVKAFNECVAAYPIGIKVRTNEGETGIVIGQNIKCPTRPILQITENANGEKYTEKMIRDLTKELTVFIEDCIE